MSRIALGSIVALLLSGVPSLAQADVPEGLYVHADLGWSIASVRTQQDTPAHAYAGLPPPKVDRWFTDVTRTLSGPAFRFELGQAVAKGWVLAGTLQLDALYQNSGFARGAVGAAILHYPTSLDRLHVRFGCALARMGTFGSESAVATEYQPVVSEPLWGALCDLDGGLDFTRSRVLAFGAVLRVDLGRYTHARSDGSTTIVSGGGTLALALTFR